MAISDTSNYNAAHGKSYQSVWEYISDMRTNQINGCNDWYIGNKAEYDQLRATSYTPFALTGSGGKSIWTSQEYSKSSGCDWVPGKTAWGYLGKTSTVWCMPIRSF